MEHNTVYIYVYRGESFMLMSIFKASLVISACLFSAVVAATAATVPNLDKIKSRAPVENIHKTVETQTETPEAHRVKTPADFRQFKPRPSNKKQLNYDIWSQLLEGSVVFVGPSTRLRPRKTQYGKAGQPPISNTGRIKRGLGHTSAYRLEGNKVMFSEFSLFWREAIHQYRVDLEFTGNEHKIARLPRNEQLAYWLNLHNAVVMDTIAQNYPLKRPRELLVDSDVPFHDALLVTIEGQALSLRDIRENIVYRYWRNPAVIYGFFHGDLSSPSIRPEAYTGADVAKQLGQNGVQFVNSLRGTHPWRGSDMRVAKLYEDVAPWYFENFNRDLKKHLLTYAGDEVREEIKNEKAFIPNIDQKIIADLIAGEPLMSRDTTQLRKEGIHNSNRAQIMRFANELETKFIILKEQGKIGTGSVIIEDIPTEDLSVDNRVPGKVKTVTPGTERPI